MAPTYSTVLFDLDHTLLDSHASEALAFDATLRGIGLADPHAHFAEYDRINGAMWRAVERHEVSPNVVRVSRFEQLLGAIGHDADPVQLADDYALNLGAFGDLYPGALDVLDELAQHAQLGLVTNGLGDVQRARLERLGILDHFGAVVISAEVGVSKPKSEIFDLAFDLLGRSSRAGALMVGDSLTSDIQGALNAGIATCWYNPRGDARDDRRIDHELRALAELPEIVVGPGR